MGSEWEKVFFGDLIEYQKGYAFKSKDYQEHGVKIVRVSNFTDRTIDVESCNKIGIEKSQLYDSYKLNTLDVIIATVGSWPKNPASVVGKAVQVPKELNGALLNQNAVRLRANIKTNQRFLFFLVKDKNFQNYIVSTAQGSANQASITLKDIFNYKFNLPPLPEQKTIAHILGTLDDKIELNRQMNETLESMAQALFKSWFVDFDPVLDNAITAGNPIPDALAERAELRKQVLAECSHPNPYAEHFPSEFEFTDEMGWIPMGWSFKEIKSIAQVIKGKSYKSTELEESTTALVTLKSFQRGGGYRLDGLKEYTGTYKPEQVVSKGDLIVAYTDVTQAADVIGKPALVMSDDRYEKLVISLDVAVIKTNSEYKFYLYLLAKTPQFQAYTYSHSTGTTVLHLSKNAIPDFSFLNPGKKLLNEFKLIVEPIYLAVEQNVCKDRTLSQLRDTLLPQLLSGKLRITDAEKKVAELGL